MTPLQRLAEDDGFQRLANTRFSPEINAALQRLSVSDNWHSLLALFAGYALIAGAVVLGEMSAWLYPLAVLVIGARQRALTTILHDAAHGRAARSKWLNWVVGSYMSGYLIFQAFKPYQHSHVLQHHWFLGHPERDPDFQMYLRAGLYNGLTPGRFFWRHVFATLFLLNAAEYLWYVTKHRSIALVRSRGESACFIAFWAVLLALLHAFDGWRLFLLYWLVPYATSFVVIGRFIEIAEHYPMVGQDTTVLRSTRNRFSHPLEALFFSMHQENYHLVHHLRPDIPFWNLESAHRKMLEDSEYRRVNRDFGGIFLSRARRPSLIADLVRGRLALPAPMQRVLTGPGAVPENDPASLIVTRSET
jgi:fatty acid desaturase